MRLSLVALFAVSAIGCGGPAFTLAGGGSDDASVAAEAGMNDATVDGAGGDASNDGESAREAGGDTGTIEGDGAAPADGEASDAERTDAGADGSADDGGPSNFRCSATDPTSTVFCCDFDESSSPPWNFTYQDVNSTSATNTADTVDYLSPPNGYEARVSEALAGNAIIDNLAYQSPQSQPLGAGVKRVSYEFWVYVKSTNFGLSSSTSSDPIAGLRLGNAAGSFSLTLYLTLDANGGLGLDQEATGADGGELSVKTLAGTLPTATWTHLTIECVKAAGGGTSVSVAIGGTLGVNGQMTIVPASFVSFEVDLGLLEVIPPTTGPNDITFDNAIVHAYDL